MAAFSTYLDNKILDHILGTASFTMPATVYVALYTVTPTIAGGGTEAAYTGYARVTTASLWSAAASGSKSNSGPLSFPACTGGSSPVVAFGILDASSAGNLLAFGSCTLSVSSGITPSFATGQLTVTLS